MNQTSSDQDGATKPDILIFFSDQHHAAYSGFAGHPYIRTPNLDALAAAGTVFDAAYSSCPLCVPARSSFLTGQLPARTGIFTNGGVIPGDQATFIHSLASAGYETVLCGRMHFLGEDQRHGFTKRIAGEYTPLFWGRYGAVRSDLGPYVGTSASQFRKIVGGGTSPVLEYDRAVIAAALEFLKERASESRKEQTGSDGGGHKPLCLVVGTYAPHHTFVAPPEWYTYYKDLIDLPVDWRGESVAAHPVYGHMRQDWDEAELRKVRTAYAGMISNLDDQLGAVRETWGRFLDTRRSDGVFVYVSDHGEQAGEHGLHGKSTFFDGSARIPMIIQGRAGGEPLASGTRVADPVSIMDIGPTLCELAGAPVPPEQDGESLAGVLENGTAPEERPILSEYISSTADRNPVPGRMVRRGPWKYFGYAGLEEHDRLFDLSEDPLETTNLAVDRREIVGELRNIAGEGWEPDEILSRHAVATQHHAILNAWGAAVDVPEPERWPVPQSAWELPTVE